METEKKENIIKEKFIIGRKLGMTRVFSDEGNSFPATVIEAGPCVVTQIKTKEKDGYSSVQIGFGEIEKPKKSENKKPFRHIREFEASSEIKEGDKIGVELFVPGDKVSVRGVSKGKGFAGVMKRWNFSGLPATHGTKHAGRKAGSIGSAYPQRVIKGKKMAGRMGGENVSVKNIEVINVDEERNIILLKGAVPGRRGALLTVRG